MALGAVYAWSVFRVPLAKQFGWSISEVTLTVTISIFVLGIAAFFVGLWLNRKGPRIVALTGGFLYGVGVFLASFSDHRRAARDVAGLGAILLLQHHERIVRELWLQRHGISCISISADSAVLTAFESPFLTAWPQSFW
jgi:MFS family permease